MLGFSPLSTSPLSSLPVVGSLFSESPVLTATALVDGHVLLSWTLNPLVTVVRFELRRSSVSAPLSNVDGQLVYSGGDFRFTDTGVIVSVTYHYTVFVVLDAAPLVYVPYEPQASDSVTPAPVRTSTPTVREYVPYSGELGVVTQPWPYGRLISVWKVNGPDHDTWTLPRGRKILSPVSGTVTSTSPLALDTDSGVRVSLSGRLTTNLAVGAKIISGRPIADSGGGEVTLKLVKLAVAEFGERVIRPSYLYLAVDRRR